MSRSDGVLDLPLHGGHNDALEAGFGNSTLTIHGVMVVHILWLDRSSGDRTWGNAREMASFPRRRGVRGDDDRGRDGRPGAAAVM